MDINTGKQRGFVFTTNRVHAQNITSSGLLKGSQLRLIFKAVQMTLVSTGFPNYNQIENYFKKRTIAVTKPEEDEGK